MDVKTVSEIAGYFFFKDDHGLVQLEREDRRVFVSFNEYHGKHVQDIKKTRFVM